MANTAYKNGVPLLNKTKASGASLDAKTSKFNGVFFTYSEFTIDTNLGTPSPTVYYNIYYPNGSTDVFQIAWGDGSFEIKKGNTGIGQNHDYTYASNGAYTVRFLPIVSLVYPNGLRNQSGQDSLFGTKLTDITQWGWSTGLTPNWITGSNCGSPNMTQPSATDPAPAGAAISLNALQATVDRGISTWGTAYKSVQLQTGQYNNQNYNEVWTGVTPNFSGGTSGGNIFNRCGSFNQNVDSWAPETRQCENWGNFFLRAFAFNNGDPAGVSGGSVGTGWDTFNVSATYASGTTTGVTTNKLIDSTATFITDEVIVGMKVHLRYGGVFTTVSSVDSETELTLADDIFTTIGDKYSVTRSNIPKIALMMSQISSFNQVIDSWDTSGQTNFQNCVGSGLNQDLRNWDISQSLNCQQFPLGAFNFGFPSGVANTYAQSWNGQTAQVQTWLASLGSAFNSDITGWQFGYPNDTLISTNTTDSELKLIDSTATFQTDGITNLYRVTNMDTGKQANVVSVDSETQLTLSADIFVGSTGQNYEVFYKVTTQSMYMGAITYDVSNLDMRCVYGMGGMFGNSTTAITAELGKWCVRNNRTFEQWYSSSGGSKASMANQNIRNWERGTLGSGTSYSTTKCNTSLRLLMYHSEVENNYPIENWDTRNVTTFATFNQNGNFRQSVAEWCMASVTTLGAAFYFLAQKLISNAYASWYQHPLGCNVGASASLLFPGGNSLIKNQTEVTRTTGTTTGVGSPYLDVVIDSSATFLSDGIEEYDRVVNNTTGKHAYVQSVDSDTQITVSQEYFGSIGDSYTVIGEYAGQDGYKGFLKLVAPTVYNIQATGTNTSTGTNRLIDSGASFLTTAAVGDVVKNTTASTSTTIIRVVSDTELSIAANRFPTAGDGYSIERFDGSAVNASGTTTSTTTLKLVDSGASFLSTVNEGDVVINTTDSTHSYVVSVDSDTELSIWDNIFVSGEGYQIEGGYGWVITSTFWYLAKGQTDLAGAVAFKLRDSDATFTTWGISPGDAVKNTNSNLYTTVVSVDSDTQLTVADDYFPNNVGYVVDYQIP
jgi:hypothetical protein